MKVDFYLSWNTERNRRASRPSWAPLSASIPWFCDAPQRHPIHPPARRCHSVRAALGRAGEGRRIPKSFVIWPGTCVWCFGVELWCLPPRPCSPVGLSWLGGSIPGLAIQIELCADEVRISSVLEVLSRHLNQNTFKIISAKSMKWKLSFVWLAKLDILMLLNWCWITNSRLFECQICELNNSFSYCLQSSTIWCCWTDVEWQKGFFGIN